MSHLRVLFCPCVVQKTKVHVETKTSNMCHQAQKGFLGIFVVIPEHPKGCLVYLPSTRKVISSYDVVFDESFSSALSYSSRPYSEAMAMRPAVAYVEENVKMVIVEEPLHGAKKVDGTIRNMEHTATVRWLEDRQKWWARIYQGPDELKRKRKS